MAHDRLRSLWDMLEPNIAELVADALYLERQCVAAETDARDNIHAQIIPSTREVYRECVNQIWTHLENLDLKTSNRAASRLIGNLEDGENCTYQAFIDMSQDLLLRLYDELELTKFLSIESSRIQFYAPARPPFGRQTTDHYPSAYFEIEEAGKCLALGRATACVFHLMRTMEVGIKAVAASLKIPDPTKPSQRNWGAILRTIKDAIDNRSKWPSRANKHFYEEVHASLDSIKNPWRNSTMHVEQNYTDEEAENIYYAVKAFMMKISSRFDENGKFLPKSSES